MIWSIEIKYLIIMETKADYILNFGNLLWLFSFIQRTYDILWFYMMFWVASSISEIFFK